MQKMFFEHLLDSGAVLGAQNIIMNKTDTTMLTLQRGNPYIIRQHNMSYRRKTQAAEGMHEMG